MNYQPDDKLKKRLLAAAIAAILSLLAYYGFEVDINPDDAADKVLEVVE